ncbi:MAG: asparagine synthase-related protein [Chloroflexota bacterium]
MSGIAALLSRDGRPANARRVTAMLAAVPYRGSDGMWVRAFGEVALGYAKLAITAEEDAELQPLVSPRSGCTVIADVRLDNRAELIGCLPDCPTAPSDAELILRAYECWGMAGVERLLGDFAFVIWDPTARHLVCARDSAGQRSLFYRQDHRVFEVASEVHQLLQEPSVQLAPNHDRIREALVPINLSRNEKDRADTYYADIRSVRAGELIVVDERSLRAWQYWRLTLPPEIRYRDSAEYGEQFRELLFGAVRARLRTSHPLGVMLSGGLDSTAITCVAQELYGAGLAESAGFATLSAVYEGLECDERPYITATQEKYGFAAHLIAPDASIEPPIGQPTSFRERPNMATSGFDTILREASRLGVRALLTGEISDSCVRGSPLVLDSLLRRGQFGAFWRYLRAYRSLTQDPWLKIASLYVAAPLLPLPVHRAMAMAYVRRAHARVGRHILPGWMPEPLQRELAERNLQLSLAEEAARTTSSESRHWDLLGLCPPEAMAHPTGWPLQLVRPFADRRLHEFLLAVPPPEKYEPHPSVIDDYAGSKQLIRRGLKGVLPEQVRTRTPPTHFASAAVERIRRRWPALASCFDPSGSSRLAEHGYIDPRRFWDRLQRLRDGRLGPDVLHIDYCLGLEGWLRSLEQPRHQVVTVQTSWSGSGASVLMDGGLEMSARGAFSGAVT